MNLSFPYQKQKLLSEVSTFGIGGPALYYAEAKTVEQMQLMLAFANTSSLKFFILGKGSNTLFDDRGFDGLVILNKIDYLKEDANEGIFRVGSGFSFPRLGGITARKGWSGLEFASGIPATVGGAIYMNAGANGKETSANLKEVSYLSEKGELRILAKDALQFAYRKSSFQQWKGAIVEAVFQLQHSSQAKSDQKQILNYRLKTQPYGEKSAGCAFRNPVDMAAGQLIEQCGLKGQEKGGAAISALHANFIVNQGGAKACDVLDLMQMIKTQVYAQKGVALEEEIRYIPYG